MEDIPTRVTCVVKRYHHHTVSGGYGRLTAALNAKVIVRKQIPGVLGKPANKAWWQWQLTAGKDYAPDDQVGDWWLS